MMELKALAKINLGLDVLRIRPDGYHTVRMIMQSIHLYDEIRIAKSIIPSVVIQTNLPYLPTNEKNIAYKAAALLREEFQISEGVRIMIEKRIPVSAGLGGGSADAAAVLFGMNRMFDLGLSTEELMKRGITLGADVPYCIMRGTVLAEGIGEVLSPLPSLPKCFVLVATPSVRVSTAKIYKALDAKNITKHPDIDGLIDALGKGDLAGVANHMGNVLEQVTIPLHPEIDMIKQELLAAGALGAMMSGSGPTVFGIFDDKELAHMAKEIIYQKSLAKQVYIAKSHTVRRG